MAAKDKMGIGIIGCGNICGAYFKGCSTFRSVEVVACADINMDAAKKAAEEHGVRQQFAMANPPAAPILNELTNLVEAGIVKPVVASVFPLEKTQEAHEVVWGRHVRGKVVIQVAE